MIWQLLNVLDALGDPAHKLFEEELLEFRVPVHSLHRTLLDHPVDVVRELDQCLLGEAVVVQLFSRILELHLQVRARTWLILLLLHLLYLLLY